VTVLLKTIVVFLLAIVPMFVLAPIGFVFWLLGFLGLKKPMTIAIYRLIQLWSKTVIWSTGCNLIVKGQEQIPKTGGLCFVSNHGSVFDIFLIIALVGRPIGFIAKKELILVPFLNLWVFLMGGLFIDRKNARKALKTINEGINRIKSGGAMIVFPEGTRSKGSGLLPFRSGAFKLATQSKSFIVPITIAGSYGLFEQTYRIRPVRICVTFAPCINTAELSAEDRRQHLADRIHGIIAGTLDEDNSLHLHS
jgi:1-acyl-sn-glycerol-3-phosphate acyltransferase